ADQPDQVPQLHDPSRVVGRIGRVCGLVPLQAFFPPGRVSTAWHGVPDMWKGRTRREPEMPQEAWSAKRERQYQHVKDSAMARGESEDVAEEIAARTVNKERTRTGEAREASRLSVTDMSSGERGGHRSHSGAGGRTRAQLYEEARRKNVKRRSSMTKA